MNYLLDTSALFAVALGQPGAAQVMELLESDENRMGISVLTKVEMWARLKSLGREGDFEREWALHLPLFEAVLPVDEAVVDRSVQLRQACLQRLPLVDSLIAGTAVVHNMILVHRDAHLRLLPQEQVRQLDLTPATP